MKILVLTIRKDWGFNYAQIHYEQDGETVRRKVEQNSLGRNIWTYHANGKVKEHRNLIGFVANATSYVYFYDDSGAQNLEQVWNVPEKADAQRNLMRAYGYTNGIARYRVNFPPNSTVIDSVIYYNTDLSWNGDETNF